MHIFTKDAPDAAPAGVFALNATGPSARGPESKFRGKCMFEERNPERGGRDRPANFAEEAAPGRSRIRKQS